MTAGDRGVPRRHDRLPPGEPVGILAQDRIAAWDRRTICDGTDLVKDPRVLEAAYDDAEGVSRGVQPQSAAQSSIAKMQADFDPAIRPRRRC